MYKQTEISPTWRSFPPKAEAIARDWFENPIETDRWEIVGPVENKHATSPVWVRKGEDVAVMKPGPSATVDVFVDHYQDLSDIFCDKSQRYVQSVPIAAIEKVAADLAYVAGFPVSPVALYRNEEALDPASQKACLSLKCFEGTTTHPKEAVSLLSDSKLASFLESYTAIAVFKAWLQNTDQRFENLALAPNTGVPSFYDFSVSSLCHWKKIGFNKPHIIDLEIGIKPELTKALDHIKAIPDALIRDIVHRIPASFIAEEDKKILETGLVARKPDLKNLILKNDNLALFNSAEEAVAHVIALRAQRQRMLQLDLEMT